MAKQEDILARLAFNVEDEDIYIGFPNKHRERLLKKIPVTMEVLTSVANYIEEYGDVVIADGDVTIGHLSFQRTEDGGDVQADGANGESITQDFSEEVAGEKESYDESTAQELGEFYETQEPSDDSKIACALCGREISSEEALIALLIDAEGNEFDASCCPQCLQ